MQWKFTLIVIPVAANASLDDIKQVQKKAETVVSELKNNGNPEKIAQEYSVHVRHLGWVTLNQVPPELQKAVAQLNHPDQMSALFKSAEGFAIVKANAIQGPQIQAFDAVKNKVKEAYIRQHAEEKMGILRDQLADLTYEHPESLQAASKALDLPIQSSELFSKEKPGKDIAQYKKVREAAFSNDVLNLQNNSDVIQLSPETMVVLRVKSHVASALLPLSNVSQQIAAKLKAVDAEAQLMKFAENLKSKLTSGIDPQQLAASSKLKWNSLGLIGRYSTKVDSAILDLAFRLPHPEKQTNKVVYGFTRIPNGYAVVALKSVKEGVITDKKQYAVFAEQIQNSEGMLEYELYKQSQTSRAKIRIEKN
jgi:peptidyl-prolyl cis-trans isomerase D